MKSLTSPSAAPSLARAFETERARLQILLAKGDKTAPMVVSETRKALDRTGIEFARETQDVQVHKAALWLIEMVKAGAGVLDSGARAEIVWKEVPQSPKVEIAGSTVFYGVAAGFGVLCLLQTSRLAILTALVLAALRFFDPSDWKRFARKIPFIGRKKPKTISGPDGLERLADARLTVNSTGFVDGIADALRTADHILLRLAEPTAEAHWHEDARLMSFVHGMLEAKTAGDGEFALRLIETELATFLRSSGVEEVSYTGKHKRLFDIMPSLGMSDLGAGNKKKVMAAPALVKGDQVLRRGTVWSADNS